MTGAGADLTIPLLPRLAGRYEHHFVELEQGGDLTGRDDGAARPRSGGGERFGLADEDQVSLRMRVEEGATGRQRD